MKTVAMLLIGNINTDGRVQKEIATLKSRGHTVTLIQWSYSGAKADRERLGIEVIHYPHLLHKSAGVNFARQLLFNSFALGHLKRIRQDIVQCNDLNTLIAGYRFRKRARIVYDAHELFPESQEGPRKAVWSWLERLMVPGCAAFIQPEKNRRSYFAEKYGMAAESIALVENFPSEKYPFTGRNRLREHFGIPSGRKIILYTGVLGPGREIENMIGSISLLDERFMLVLLGPTFKGYDQELNRLVAQLGLGERVKFHPAIPNSDMLDFIASGDIGLVFYKNTNLNNFWCASNKLYEFIHCGKPVITNDYPGLREVVEKNGLGACLPSSDPASIAEAVNRVIDSDLRANGPSPYVWERQEENYLRLFR